MSTRKHCFTPSEKLVYRNTEYEVLRGGGGADFSAHSTRAASASKAKQKGLSIDVIVDTMGWSRTRAFAAYYDQPCVQPRTFSDTILS